MKMLHVWAIPLLCLLQVPLLADEPPVPDIEDAPTPTTLAELLPEDRAGGLEFGYWLKAEYGGPNGLQARSRPAYYHRGIRRQDDGSIVFTRQRLIVANDKAYLVEHRLVYGTDGKVIDITGGSKTDGQATYTVTSKIEGKTLAVTRTYDPEAGNYRPPDTTEIALDQLEGSIPLDWAPLVYAYHIRKGSLGYRLKLHDLVSNGAASEMHVEDLGVETVEHNGVEKKAHLLATTRRYERRGETYETTARLLVLENGQTIWSESVSGNTRSISTPVTDAQVAEDAGWEDPGQADDQADQPEPPNE